MRKTTSTLVALLVGLTMWAGPVSREQARQEAREYLATKGVVMTTEKPVFNAPRRAQANDEAYYYVFNVGQDQGFVVMSGDDRTAPVLGYCDHGTFDEATMPEPMRSFLQGYADDIRLMDEQGVETPKLLQQQDVRRVKPVHRAIAPLVKSHWNQGDPYNRMCPEYYNSDGTRGEHAVTGCVATAIAQVINYWKHPEYTRANIPSHTNTYNTPDGQKEVTLPTIRRYESIDWEHMRDVYTADNTDEEKDAVAKLMLMVGQAVKMGYGASSGAVHGTNVPDILKNIFGFDDSAWCASRENYTVEAWTELLYGELAEGRPVSFSGHSTGGGHAFVVDGYDVDGLFHLNWGWGGGSDGYFRITILNPGDNSGIGASSSSDGYSMSQMAMIAVKLPDKVDEKQYANMTITDPSIVYLNAGGDYREEADDTYFRPAVRARYINWTGAVHEFDAGLGFLKDDGTFQVIGSINSFSLGINYLRWYNNPVVGLDPGTYKLAPISRQRGSKEWGTCFNMDTEWIEAVVDENKAVTLTYIRPVDGLTVENIVCTSNRKAGDKQTVDVTFNSSLTEYYGTIYLFASQTESKGSRTSCSAVSVPVGKPETITFFFDTKAGQTGNWHLWVATDSGGNNVIGETDLEITEKGVSVTKSQDLSITSHTWSNMTYNVFYGDFLNGTITLKNNGKTDFDGNVRVTAWLEILDRPGWYNTRGNAVVHVTIPAGGTATASYIINNIETNRHVGISVYNIYASEDIQGLRSVADIQPGIISYMANGNITGAAPGSVFRTMAQTAAVDLRGLDKVKTVRDAGYANTIYFVDEDADIAGLEGLNVVRGGHADEIHLADGLAYFCPFSFTADKVSLARTFVKGSTGIENWSTMMLPFVPESITTGDYTLRWKADEEEKDLFVKEFSHLTDDNVVQFSFVDNLVANNPYVVAIHPRFEGKEVLFAAENVELQANIGVTPRLVSEAFDFFGVWAPDRIGKVYLLNTAGTAFEPVTRNTNIDGMRGYFVAKLPADEQPDKIVISNEVLAGIQDAIATQAGSAAVYNLQGQKVEQPSKGIYIVAGRKVVVK